MIAAQDSQIAAFLSRLPHQDAADDGVSPRVLFPGDLVLTRAQEEAMIDHALRRKQELEEELGRREVLDQHGLAVPQDGDIDGMKFLPKRALFEAMFEQKFDWRRDTWGGLYREGQNLHMPMLRRMANQMIARALNYFFGSDPWFGATQVGESDQITAQSLDQFLKWKLERGRIKRDLESAVKKAFIAGEQVVKTRHWTDAVFYEKTATHAVDPESGHPFLARDGECITDEDAWLEPEPGVKVLERDPATLWPEGGLVWRTGRIRRKVVRCSGPEAKCVSRKDFLAPLDTEDLQLADCVVHLYDLAALEVVNLYITRLQKLGRFDPEEWPRVMELLRAVSGESREPKAGARQPRQELGESDGLVMPLAGDPTFEAGEFYLTYDANGDGQAEHIQLLLDVKTRTPISYEHVPNVFRDARRPFHVVRVNPVEGRWCGLGVGEILYHLQKFVDLVVNRWDMSISTSGAVTFWNPDQTFEGQNNPHLALHGGKTYRKRDPRMRAEEIVERVWLHDFKGASLQDILQFALQMMTNLLGVANVNDAQMAGLETAKLATGVRNMEKSGQEQFAPYISHLEEGVHSVTTACARLAVWHMDPHEAASVLENDSLLPLTDATRALRALDFDVNLELTRYRAEQAAAESAYAVGTVMEFYGMDVQFQELLQPLFRQRLKSYGVKNPDNYLVPGAIQPPDGKSAGAAPPAMPLQGSSPSMSPEEAIAGATEATQEPDPTPNL